MSTPSQPPHPTLTPQLCFSTSTLRSFLRLSRAAIDDPISQHLSSLSHPSSTPFNSSSISAARPASSGRRNLPPSTCAGFVSHTLFPAWAARARVLEYCGSIAEQRQQPETPTRGQWGGTTGSMTGGILAIGAGVVGTLVEEEGQRAELAPDGQRWSSSRTPRVVGDERLDPYSARNYNDESEGERLARTIREELAVERIVRARSWAVVKDRCGAGMEGWEEGMRTWEGEMGKLEGRGEGRELGEGKGWLGVWR